MVQRGLVRWDENRRTRRWALVRLPGEPRCVAEAPDSGYRGSGSVRDFVQNKSPLRLGRVRARAEGSNFEDWSGHHKIAFSGINSLDV